MKPTLRRALLSVLLTCALFLCSCSGQTKLEISTKEADYAFNMEQISISGEVNSPGIYPLYAGDTLQDLLSAAGGVSSEDAKYSVSLTISEGDNCTPQKINLNRAEKWLLMALPGIGEDKAEAIINYRQTFGSFSSIFEITRVEGIGTGTYESIKGLITVAE